VVFGCKKSNHVATFELKNYSDESIFVKYLVYDTGDTSLVEINGDERFELFVTEANSEAGYNWYYDYGILINSITNIGGDSVNFNPNVPHKWISSSNNSGRLYVLGISSSNF